MLQVEATEIEDPSPGPAYRFLNVDVFHSYKSSNPNKNAVPALKQAPSHEDIHGRGGTATCIGDIPGLNLGPEPSYLD
jgi:hypothetical protein